MAPSLSICLTALLAVLPGVWAIPSSRVRAVGGFRNMTIMDETPQFPSDPNTAPSCRWWWDNQGQIPCKDMPAEWGISMEHFLAWNPSITIDCGNFLTGRSYCVEADPPGPGQPPSSSSTTGPPASTTAPGNGVTTPTPHQAMISNCSKFYFVNQGDNCATIASNNGISTTQFIQWNPDVGPDCSDSLHNAPSDHHGPRNGVTTPTPHQAMVSNCNRFYFVNQGDNCATIASNHGISTAQFIQWNPDVGPDCTGMWASVHVCVGLIGQASTTTTSRATASTTTPGNGVITPTPTQPSIVGNCNRFYFVVRGDTCATIATKHGVSTAQVISWNPSVGADCTGLWAEAYACVGVIGQASTTTTRATTTTRGNGVATPTPTQPSIVSNCNRFYFVVRGDNCQVIATKHSITVAQVIRWNPSVGSDCTGLWADAYACVGVIG